VLLTHFTYKVLVPVYNGEQVLGATLHALLQVVAADCVLVIDDGSADESAQVAQSMGVQVLKMGINQGKGMALCAGIKHCLAQDVQWCITMDADGQHSPKDLERFLQSPVDGRLGIIVGQRQFWGSNMPWLRIFSNTVSTWLVSLVAGQKTYDSQCGFRAYHTILWPAGCLPTQGRFEWESEALILTSRAGFGIGCVPIQTIYEKETFSHIKHRADTMRFLRMLYKYIKKAK
jgi:glycosyltransferase involved in cell wall biosynthesis